MHELRRSKGACVGTHGVEMMRRLALARVLPALAILALLCGLSAPMGMAHAEDMSFRLVSLGNPMRCGSGCPAVIAAEGEITDRTPYDFRSFVENNVGRADLHAIIFLNSPGGKVVAAMELGRIWRRLGVAAIVGRADPAQPGNVTQFLAARCLSACVYALIGAKKRVIPPASVVGIHRMFFYEGEGGPIGDGTALRRHYDNGGMKALLSHYTGRMGVSPALIAMAERISSDHIHILSRAEIARYHLGSGRF
ncbi:MAG: hypothetical protein WCF20_15500 [Methylovirgula sp.]